MTTRVWDPFLTEQDRALITRQVVRRSGAGARPALLMVDLYRWVFGDRREPVLDAIDAWPASCGPAAWDALPSLQALLSEARQAGIPIIHVTGTRGIPHWRHFGLDDGEESPDDPVGDERRRRRFDIVDEVAPAPGEPVLTKAAPSAFWGTPLTALLQRAAIDTVIVAGESTSGCVRATVVDAASHRYRVMVVEECVFDRHQAAHAVNLFDMDQKYADVVDLPAAVDYLRRVSAGGAAAPASAVPVARS